MPKRVAKFDITTAKIITRQQASAAGLTRYFTGQPCVNGHLCQRYVSTSGCLDCIRPPRDGQIGGTGLQANHMVVWLPYTLTLEQHAQVRQYVKWAAEYWLAERGLLLPGQHPSQM